MARQALRIAIWTLYNIFCCYFIFLFIELLVFYSTGTRGTGKAKTGGAKEKSVPVGSEGQ
jgi:hypothetical protein